jgi:hypothetical protein
MTGELEQISGLLHEAGETHHRVFRIVDGADDDWASWYAQWLIDLSELPDLLGARPVRSELIYLLVSLDKQYTAEAPRSLHSSDRQNVVYAAAGVLVSMPVCWNRVCMSIRRFS